MNKFFVGAVPSSSSKPLNLGGGCNVLLPRRREIMVYHEARIGAYRLVAFTSSNSFVASNISTAALTPSCSTPAGRTLHEINKISSPPPSVQSITKVTCDRDTGIVTCFPPLSSSLQPQNFQTIIGIEIHAQLSTPTKLFSSTPTRHHPSFTSSSSSSSPDEIRNQRQQQQQQPPPRSKSSSVATSNTLISPFDIAYPGTLPLLSSSAIKHAVLSSAALQCTINNTSRFERKHYFYADLPPGYQITQQRWPVAINGALQCRTKKWIQREKKTETEHELDQGGGEEKMKKKKERRRGQRRQQQQQEQEEKQKGLGSQEAGAEIQKSLQSQKEEEQQQQHAKFFQVGIERVQIEQDTGKTTTVTERMDGNIITRSLVDFNRAGCALIEIVFRPDIRSAHQAASAVSTLQQLLKHIGTCDGKMEEGSLRCDLNVSIVPLGNEEGGDFLNHNELMGRYDANVTNEDLDNPFRHSLPFGTGHRVEVKNLNSIRQVVAAAEYEAIRQAKAYMIGSPTRRETRTFDPRTGKTVKIRTKGGAVDYRFMPEPDLPPLILNEKTLDGKTLQSFLDEHLPELPEEATSRLMEQYGLSEELALVITSDRPAIAMYETAVEVATDELRLSKNNGNHLEEQLRQVPNAVANWLCNDLFGLVKESATRQYGGSQTDSSSPDDVEDNVALNHPISVEYSKIDGKRLGHLLAIIIDETVSTTMGKKILSVMYNEEHVLGPREIAEARGWKVIKDPLELRRLCEQVVLDSQNAAQLDQYRKGGKHVRKIQKFFVGKIMAASKGNAHPEHMMEALRHVLKEVAPEVSSE